MITTPKMLGLILAAFVAGAFSASPVPAAIAAVIASDVVCTGCVGTSDLAGNAVTGAKIKDGEVKAAEIAANAVGGSELQGVSKLLFGQCTLTDAEKTTVVSAGDFLLVFCNISGVDSDDTAVATLNIAGGCFIVSQAQPQGGAVKLVIRNDCSATSSIGLATQEIGIIVFDK